MSLTLAGLGIDIGTATTRAAVYQVSGTERASVPSCCALGDRGVVVGQSAWKHKPLLTGLKRLVGRTSRDPMIQRFEQLHGVSVEDDRDDLSIVLPGGDTVAVGVAISALVEAVGGQRGGAGSPTALVVPGWFSQHGRVALEKACGIAGREVTISVLDAVAIGAWLCRDRMADRNGETLVVIDVGAGGVSGAVMRRENNAVYILGRAASAEVGGCDVDEEILSATIDTPSAAARPALLRASEKLKRELSKCDSVKRRVTVDDVDTVLTMERWELDLILARNGSVVARVCRELLASPDVEADRIDDIYLAGGMAHERTVQAAVTSAFGLPPRPWDHCLDACASGAALIAAGLDSDLPRIVIREGPPAPKTPRRMRPTAKEPAVARAGAPDDAPEVRVAKRAPERHRPEVKRTKAAPGQRRQRRPDAHQVVPRRRTRPDAAASIGSRPEDPSSSGSGRSPGDAQPRSTPVARTTPGPASTPPAPSTPEPSTPEPSTPEPSTPEPSTPEPSTPEPSTPEPSTPEPSTPEPSTPEPTSVPPAPSTPDPRSSDAVTIARAPALPRSEAPAAKPTEPDGSRIRKRAGDSGAWPTMPPPAPSDSAPKGAVTADDSAALQPPPSSASSSAKPRRSSGSKAHSSGVVVPASSSFIAPTSAADILTLPLRRPLVPEDLERLTLVVLMRRLLARRSVSGTLTIDAAGFSGSFSILEGAFELTRQEHTQLISAFDVDRAQYRLTPGFEDALGRKSYAMIRLVVDGLRSYARRFSPGDLRDALGEDLNRAPVIRADRKPILRRLPLQQREQRMIDAQLDGEHSGNFLIDHGGLGKHTAASLLMMLSVFDLLAWEDPERQRAASLTDALEAFADRVERVNYFDALGVHWSTADGEIRERYRKAQQEYGEGSVNHGTNPQACDRIRKRLEEAFDCLSNAERRTSCRKVTYGDLDFEAATQLAEARGESLALRGRAREALASQNAAKELAKSIDRRASRAYEEMGKALDSEPEQ